MPSAPYYVTTDATGRWSGSGLKLSAAQADENIWKLHDRIDSVELIEPVGITGFSATGSNFYVQMTDNTTKGPFTLPVSTWTPRGDWVASTAYALNDIVNCNGSSYLVLYAHTSELSFDEAQTDGLGHSYYGKIFETPGSSLPTGGGTGYFLVKTSSVNYATEWVANPLPTGGSTGHYLVKNSSTNFDVEWAESPLPTGGDTGYLLAKSDSADFAVEWIAPTNDLPVGGSTGQYLAKTSSNDYETGWTTLVNDLPTGGSTGYMLAKTSSNDYETAWSTDYTRAATTVTGATGIGTSALGVIVDRAKYRITPTGNVSITASTSYVIGNFEIIVTTTGTTAYTVTFSTGLKSTGTLDTGIVGAKKFVISFVGDGAGYYEVSRTTAM